MGLRDGHLCLGNKGNAENWSWRLNSNGQTTLADPNGNLEVRERQGSLLTTFAPRAFGGEPASISPSTPDTTPPSLDNLAVTPACLWPPNHKFVAYELGQALSVTLQDACDPNPTLAVSSIESSEPTHAPGRGNTGPDFPFNDTAFCLRSGRAGNGPGRQYTIHLRASDASANQSSAATAVTVPHDAYGPGLCGPR